MGVDKKIENLQNESNKTYFGRNELFNDEKYLPDYHKWIVDLCIKHCKKTKKKIIDFGAGIGTLSLIFKKEICNAPLCVELDEFNTTQLVERGLEQFSSITEIKKKVGVVFSSNVLEHIEDDLRALKEINQSLEDGGEIFLYLPALEILWSAIDEKAGHYRRYSKKDLVPKVQKCGFKVISCYYADSIGFFAALAVKLFLKESNGQVVSINSLRFYNKYLLPLSKFFDALGLRFLFGKNIVLYAVKESSK